MAPERKKTLSDLMLVRNSEVLPMKIQVQGIPRYLGRRSNARWPFALGAGVLSFRSLFQASMAHCCTVSSFCTPCPTGGIVSRPVGIARCVPFLHDFLRAHTKVSGPFGP